MPAAASAQEPPQLVAGANSKWISGSLLQQIGLNCSVAIIGNSYTEVMVSGIASYGGAASGGIPKVGEPYWTAFLVSIPGNPCGSGSSSVVTHLILPPSTQLDISPSRQVKCYGLPRSQSGWQDLTNASWNFLGQSGPYCADQPGVSQYNGGLRFGFRPLASGQMFWIFVPVKSSAPLIGAGGPSPGHGFTWLTDATAAYESPGRSFVWANVVPTSGVGSTTPFVYFARDPTVIPFWKEDSPNDPNHPTMPGITTKSRAEFFANLYSAGKAGNFCWQLDYGPAISPPLAIDDCVSRFPGWNGTINTSGDLWQVFGDGPNGGYAPLYFDDDPPNTEFTLRWKFIPTDGSGQVFKDATFKTLAGPDQDGDGVPNNGTDNCPTVKGTLPNGCMPPPQGDDDGDGVFGANDKCPAENGKGAQDGCPGIEPQKPAVLLGAVSVKKGALFKGSALAKGAAVRFTCTVDSSAAGTLTITKKTAKRLKINTKKKNVVLASGKGLCKASGGGSLKLKVVRAYAKKLRRARRLPGSLAVKLTAPGQTPVTMKQSVKFG